LTSFSVVVPGAVPLFHLFYQVEIRHSQPLHNPTSAQVCNIRKDIEYYYDHLMVVNAIARRPHGAALRLSPDLLSGGADWRSALGEPALAQTRGNSL
jgi:hypothetical protein